MCPRKLGLGLGWCFEKIIIFYNMKCKDIGMTSVWETGMDGNRRYGHGHYLHESWMTWHEGMLSVGYEIRRLTGKLDLTGTLGYADGRNHVMWIRQTHAVRYYLGEKKNYYLEMLTAVAIGWRFGMAFDMKCHDM